MEGMMDAASQGPMVQMEGQEGKGTQTAKKPKPKSKGQT
jgi:hypothetical protein